MTAYLVDYTFATIHQRKRALCEKRQLEEPHLSDSGGKYVSQNVVHAKMFHDILKYHERREITKRCALRTIAEAIIRAKSQKYGQFSQNARIYGRARIYKGGFVTLQFR